MSTEKKQKKLMLLGGLRYLLPVIEEAHKLGVHVITVDYLPDNIAHKYSDEYHNLSILDKEAILDLAKKLGIDGIMSFAVDPGVVTAAYVAEEMGLPFAGSYESVKILQNKDLFRRFLADNGFNVPYSASFSDYNDAINNINEFSFPIIVKPTDSAGSKGVTRVDTEAQLKEAFAHALKNSISGKVIIEEFIEKQGYSSDSDCFSIDGILRAVTFSDQRFDENASNPFAPCAFSWPSSFPPQHQAYLSSELQRLITLLDLKSSIYNVETRIGKDGKAYIMEVSPRGGGNRLAEVIKLGTGLDLIRASVKSALGESAGNLKTIPFDGYWAEIILHANHAGFFDSIEISQLYQANIVQLDLWINKNDQVFTFNGANNSVGTIILKFDDPKTLNEALNTIPSWCKIKISESPQE